MFRHHFQQTEMTRTLYDVLTCLVTRLFMAYTTFPFVLLELGVSSDRFLPDFHLKLLFVLQASLRLYLKLFMCLHLIAVLTIYVLPILTSGSSDKRSSTVTALTKTSDNCASKSSADDAAPPKNDELVAASHGSVVATIRKQHSENDESSTSSSACSSFCNSMNDISDKNHQRKTDTNYLLKDLINKEVNKIRGETDNLSNLLMEKIEAANIEGLIDKTVSGIVELKDDLMRMNEPEVYGGGAVDGLRKRNLTGLELELGMSGKGPEGVDTFLKKEIDAIKEANVIPAVLSNGHAK